MISAFLVTNYQESKVKYEICHIISLNLQSNTLPRPNKPRLPCLIESASEVSPPSLETVPPLANEVVTSKLPVTPQVSLDEAKPPIPPKPFSPSLSFMSARPFRKRQIAILSFLNQVFDPFNIDINSYPHLNGRFSLTVNNVHFIIL